MNQMPLPVKLKENKFYQVVRLVVSYKSLLTLPIGDDRRYGNVGEM
jgi:hypothetical protein